MLRLIDLIGRSEERTGDLHVPWLIVSSAPALGMRSSRCGGVPIRRCRWLNVSDAGRLRRPTEVVLRWLSP